NLLVAALLIASASLAFLVECLSLRSLESSKRSLADQAATLRLSVNDAAAHITSLGKKLEQCRASVNEMHSALAAASSTTSVVPLEPEREGLWPEGKSYFYVQKKYLSGAWLPWLKGDYHLHPDAAVLLGM